MQHYHAHNGDDDDDDDEKNNFQLIAKELKANIRGGGGGAWLHACMHRIHTTYNVHTVRTNMAWHMCAQSKYYVVEYYTRKSLLIFQGSKSSYLIINNKL